MAQLMDTNPATRAVSCFERLNEAAGSVASLEAILERLVDRLVVSPIRQTACIDGIPFSPVMFEQADRSAREIQLSVDRMIDMIGRVSDALPVEPPRDINSVGGGR